MKLCKVKIRKIRDENDTQCQFVYPDGYSAKIIKPFAYENRGNEYEHCLAEVPDDFIFSNDMAEIDPYTAKLLVHEWADNDKDISSEIDRDNLKISKEKYCK
ncbi:MAG: hypothetical protein GF411_14445 [Candidatus Lokiarchaeota archaeon]|nr:hypothetical protein [Candidatus Lokiarchaeota archaeon]